MKPLNVTREDFPHSERTTEGMIVIQPECGRYEVQYFRDVVYAVRGEQELHLQILLPAGRRTPAPLILFVPGSAFYRQDVVARVPNLSYWAGKGYAVALLEYRGSEDAAFPAVVVDAKAGLVFLREHAQQYNIDPERMITMGDSSGGYTALMAGLTYQVDALEDELSRGKDYHVCGVVDFYGPTDISTMQNEPSSMDHVEPDCPEGQLIGGRRVEADKPYVQETIIKNYVADGRKLPPVLMFHGSADELVPFGQSCELYEAMRETGHEVTFYQMKGAHHGGSEFWSEEVLKIVEEFMQNAWK